MIRRRRAVALLAGGAVAVLAAGCGEDDFENEPRPAAARELTGVIQEDKVTVSPRNEGAGPFLITVSNQTDEAHTVILEGETIREQVGPVQPLDVATIQKTLEPGTYEVKAGSDVARERQIEPAVLTVGKPRKSSNDQLLLP